MRIHYNRLFIRSGLYNKTGILLFLCLSGFLPAYSQYYYQDIYKTNESNRLHQKYKEQNVKSIKIESFDAENTLNKDFKCKKVFSADYSIVDTKTSSFSTGASDLVSYFDSEGRIIHTIDSSQMSISQTWVYYDAKGRIDSLVFLSETPHSSHTDTLLQHDYDYKLRETHHYQYDAKGNLVKMQRVKNRHPFSTVTFLLDSAGHVYKEEEKQANRSIPPYYYKYNDAGYLTDVFHFSTIKKRMVPDYLFNYDDNGRLQQKTVVLTDSHNYLKWHYGYDENGNIAEEKCYNRKQELQGSLKFGYHY